MKRKSVSVVIPYKETGKLMGGFFATLRITGVKGLKVKRGKYNTEKTQSYTEKLKVYKENFCGS